jgi:hypothetical protein
MYVVVEAKRAGQHKFVYCEVLRVRNMRYYFKNNSYCFHLHRKKRVPTSSKIRSLTNHRNTTSIAVSSRYRSYHHLNIFSLLSSSSMSKFFDGQYFHKPIKFLMVNFSMCSYYFAASLFTILA